MPTYTVFDPMVTAYKAEIAKDCPSCSVTEDDFTLPQMLGGQLVPAVVSAAKRIPNLKYIVSVNGAFTDTLPEALKAAGLAGKYQVISGQGVSTDQQNVLTGSQLATVSGPFILGGWQDMDMAIRFAMHLRAVAGRQRRPLGAAEQVQHRQAERLLRRPDRLPEPVREALARRLTPSTRGRRRLPPIESLRVRSGKRHWNSKSF